VKPAPFEYHAPRTVEEAIALLAELDDAKILAGGQSLVPLLNFRLARPAHLVDINRLADLAYIERRDGGLAVGALTRQADGKGHPLLERALRLVAHPVIRNRGTIVGSVVHADPAAELPATLLALGGHVVARSPRGQRMIGAEELYRGPLDPALEPDELVVEAFFPFVEGPMAIDEIARRHGDFALAGAVRAGNRLALFGVAPTPVLADMERPTNGLRPSADLEASPEFRLHLVEHLVERVITAAA
jgi:carbon-monoxide dehydrogenase medium subunit